MAKYVRETHSYDDDGFTTMGRVVAVLSHSATNRRITVLVEKSPQVSFERIPDEVSAKGVTLDEIAAEVKAFQEATELDTDGVYQENPTCAGKDGECSRTVDEPGDLCWQHETD